MDRIHQQPTAQAHLPSPSAILRSSFPPHPPPAAPPHTARDTKPKQSVRRGEPTHPAMPPKCKSPATAVTATVSPRKTRSMAAAGKRGTEPAPAKKENEAAVAEPKARKRAKKDEAVTVAAEQKKVRKTGKKEAEAAAPAAEEEDGGDAVAGGRRVIVEACTQCRQFKIRAQKVKEELESSVPGVSVIINPQKPRRGCLEIREEGGEVFISLLNMPRPFAPMKKLDMDEVIEDIAKKIS